MVGWWVPVHRGHAGQKSTCLLMISSLVQQQEIFARHQSDWWLGHFGHLPQFVTNWGWIITN
jgi:hypothetical protein